MFTNPNATRTLLLRNPTSWLACIVFVAVLAAGQANATFISQSFTGFPSPDPFTQQDKTWSGFTDVFSNLPSGFGTAVATTSGVVPGQNTHSFTLNGTFAPSTTYEVTYTVAVKAGVTGVTLEQAATDLLTTVGATPATITTTITNAGPFTVPPDATFHAVPPGSYLFFNVTDTIQTNQSNVFGFTNSFIEKVPIVVPEPASLALFGTAVLGLAAVLRRKHSTNRNVA